ncbi:hypothetical protein [Shewanella woodyi]|uniref:hypothetical protein n=1 Tax=Shewanella woodyi TaxID=60961 RepID=UPI0012FBC883|nr:hypothetical protein [Shewanella woodyi]
MRIYKTFQNELSRDNSINEAMINQAVIPYKKITPNSLKNALYHPNKSSANR